MGRVRRLGAIVRSTALEVLSEPLTLLLLLAALVLTVVAPVFHYHQFGEATRMARDSGLSALFTCGSALAVFATIRTFRREIESGTAEMTLVHPVSRTGFFLAKTLGATAAVVFFSAIVAAAMVTSVTGAAIGGHLAEKSGDLARIWGPCVASGVATILLPLVLGAALNRFARCRFVLSALRLALAFALFSAAGFSVLAGPHELVRLLPPTVALAVFILFLVTVAAAAAVRLKAHAAAAATGVVVALCLPFVGNYYLAEALANGGSLGWTPVGLAALALMPAVAAFLLLGVRLCREMD